MRYFNFKTFDQRRDRLFISILCIGFSLYFAFSLTTFAAGAESVKSDVVRLHILANSDSSQDQNVKIKVRDALLSTNAEILGAGVNTENAKEYFENSKKELSEAARAVLKENGFDYDVKLTLGKEYFETREYGGYVFPAGNYTSLKVVLGEGEGKNWWCVMFPPMCIPAASDIETDGEKITDCLSESGIKTVSDGKKYVVKLKILEIFEELKNKAWGE